MGKMVIDRAAVLAVILIVALFGAIFFHYGLPRTRTDWLVGVALATVVAAALYLTMRALIPR
jgi:hypothetical protein